MNDEHLVILGEAAYMTLNKPVGKLLVGDKQYEAIDIAWITFDEAAQSIDDLLDRYPEMEGKLIRMKKETRPIMEFHGLPWEIVRVESPDYMAVE